MTSCARSAARSARSSRVDRYLDAFEAGTLREQQCGRCIKALTAELVDLKTRQDELRLAGQRSRPRRTRKSWPSCWSGSARRSNQGPLPVRKTLVDALVEEIRVRGRDHIVPVFRLPNGRHPPDGAVRPGVRE